MMGELQAALEDMFAAFERGDADALVASAASGAQGVDELSRKWMRGADEVRNYLRGLVSMVTDVKTVVSDGNESIKRPLTDPGWRGDKQAPIHATSPVYDFDADSRTFAEREGRRPPSQGFRAVISQTALPNRTPSGVSCDRSAAFSFSCASARATSSRPSDRPLTIPIPPTNAYAASASAPNHSGSSNDVNSTASKPTRVSRPSTSSRSASAAGPGAPGGGIGTSRPAAIDSRTTMIHSLLAVACQTNRAMRPPRRRAEAMLAKAAGRSLKNIDPKRLIARSKVTVSKACTCASARRNSTFVRPSARARRRASASIDSERSTPSADPSLASRAASRVD